MSSSLDAPPKRFNGWHYDFLHQYPVPVSHLTCETTQTWWTVLLVYVPCFVLFCTWPSGFLILIFVLFTSSAFRFVLCVAIPTDNSHSISRFVCTGHGLYVFIIRILLLIEVYTFFQHSLFSPWGLWVNMYCVCIIVYSIICLVVSYFAFCHISKNAIDIPQCLIPSLILINILIAGPKHKNLA